MHHSIAVGWCCCIWWEDSVTLFSQPGAIGFVMLWGCFSPVLKGGRCRISPATWHSDLHTMMGFGTWASTSVPPCVLSLGHEFSVGNSLHPPDVGVGKEDTGSPEAGQTTSREGSGVTLPIPEVHWGGEGCKGEVAPAGEPKAPRWNGSEPK